LTATGPARAAGTAPKRHLRRDAAYVAAGQLAAVASAFLMTVVAARVLPARDFGALSWALSWLTYLAVVAQLGLTQVATIAFAGRAHDEHPVLLRRLLAAQALGVLAVGAVWEALLGPVTAASGTPPAAYRPLVAVVALWLPAAAVGPVLVNALRARSRFGLSLVFGEHVRRVLLIAILLVAAVAGSDPSLSTVVWWTVAVESVVYLAGVAALVGVVAGRRPRRPGPPPRWTTGGLVRFGSSFTLATLASATVPQAGVWLLAAFAPVEEVAVLSVAVRIAVLLATPTAIGMRTLAPRIAAAHEAGDLATLEEPMQRFALWSTAATVAATVALAVTGPALLPAVFGDGYGRALAPALLLSAGAVVNAWTGPASAALSHAGHQRTVAISALVAALGFLAGSALLAPIWGANGVATMASLAMSGRNLHLARAAHRSLGLRTTAVPCRKGI
jgi:O-antigen/teichoic acid export membrane protein